MAGVKEVLFTFLLTVLCINSFFQVWFSLFRGFWKTANFQKGQRSCSSINLWWSPFCSRKFTYDTEPSLNKHWILLPWLILSSNLQNKGESCSCCNGNITEKSFFPLLMIFEPIWLTWKLWIRWVKCVYDVSMDGSTYPWPYESPAEPIQRQIIHSIKKMLIGRFFITDRIDYSSERYKNYQFQDSKIHSPMSDKTGCCSFTRPWWWIYPWGVEWPANMGPCRGKMYHESGWRPRHYESNPVNFSDWIDLAHIQSMRIRKTPFSGGLAGNAGFCRRESIRVQWRVTAIFGTEIGQIQLFQVWPPTVISSCKLRIPATFIWFHYF